MDSDMKERDFLIARDDESAKPHLLHYGSFSSVPRSNSCRGVKERKAGTFLTWDVPRFSCCFTYGAKAPLLARLVPLCLRKHNFTLLIVYPFGPWFNPWLFSRSLLTLLLIYPDRAN